MEEPRATWRILEEPDRGTWRIMGKSEESWRNLEHLGETQGVLEEPGVL